MDDQLLSDLICPVCRDAVDYVPLGEKEGLLDCGNSHLFPVVGDIPRMLPDALRSQLDFAGRHGDVLSARGFEAPSEQELNHFNQLNAQVRDRFTFEWLRYPGGDPLEEEQIFFEETMWEQEELHGSTVLDAGCGMGRFTQVAARYAERVVAIDLGGAIERVAREAPPNLHAVQGDLLNPPFRPECFDAAYSLGVLHHTPDTFDALDQVTRMVKRGGLLSAWVYGRAGNCREFRGFPFAHTGPAGLAGRLGLPGRLLHYAAVRFREASSNALRRWTTTLEAERLYRYTSLLAHLGRFRLLNMLLPVSTHPDQVVRCNDTFDWYAPDHQHHHTQVEMDGMLSRLDLNREATLTHGFIPKVGFRARRG